MTLHILPLLDANPSALPTHRRDFALDGIIINDQYKFLKKIGAGTYGLIYLVEDMATGCRYAAKMVLTDYTPTSMANASENKLAIQRTFHQYFVSHSPVKAQELDLEIIAIDGVNHSSLREIALHLRVHQHPNVVSIHGVLSLPRFAVITMMDYFPQGDLFGNIIDKQLFLRPPVHQDKQLLMKNCMLQLVEAVQYCALLGVYHCDLKPENVMVVYDPMYKRLPGSTEIVDHSELRIALIDFGLAMTSNLICCNACRGSSFYMAPERIVNFNTNKLVRSMINMDQFPTSPDATLDLNAKLFPTLAGDIWLLGVLFINITCARNPWPVANINDRHEVFANYMLQNKSILQTILPILRQFNLLLNQIFDLNPNMRILVSDLAAKIKQVDFFHDKVEYNEQLCTPPTELKSLPPTPTTSIAGKSGYKKVAVNHINGWPASII